jgi:hypothetical protein
MSHPRRWDYSLFILQGRNQVQACDQAVLIELGQVELPRSVREEAELSIRRATRTLHGQQQQQQ